jgi:putative phosphoribosyl transferase
LDQVRFRDRSDAGRQLARRLLHLRDSRPVVLALPRGGVPVAAEVAQTLGASLDHLFVRKNGAPGHRELALAAIVDGAKPLTVINEDVRKAFSVSDNYIAMESARELREIKRRSAAYLRGRSPPELRDRTVIVVDDGIATGATVKVALQALRATGAAKRVLAVPVGRGMSLRNCRTCALSLSCFGCRISLVRLVASMTSSISWKIPKSSQSSMTLAEECNSKRGGVNRTFDWWRSLNREKRSAPNSGRWRYYFCQRISVTGKLYIRAKKSLLRPGGGTRLVLGAVPPSASQH